MPAERVTAWTTNDMITVVDTHIRQLGDIQYAYTYRLTPSADTSFVDKFEINLKWVSESNWECRQSKFTGNTYHGRIYLQTDAWNGEIHQTRETIDNHVSAQRMSSYPPMFATFEPMQALQMRGGTGRTVLEILKDPGAKVMGEDEIDGRPAVLVHWEDMPVLPSTEHIIVHNLWLDMGRGGLVLKSELWVKGQLAIVVENVKIKEIKSGLFFPVALTLKSLTKKESASIWRNGSEIVAEIDQKSINVNQNLSKKEFFAGFDPNLPIWNDDLGLNLPANGEPPIEEIDVAQLSDVSSSAAQDYNNAHSVKSVNQETRTPDTGTPATKTIWLWGVATVFVVCFAAVLWRLHIRKQRRKMAAAIWMIASTISMSSFGASSTTAAEHERLQTCCGMNSIFVLLEIEGLSPNLRQMLAVSGTQQKMPQLSLNDLKLIAKEYRHNMLAVRISPQELIHLSHPFIAQLRHPKTSQAHFITGWSVNDDAVQVVDYPEKYIVTTADFAQAFTGYALIAAAERDEERWQHAENGSVNPSLSPSSGPYASNPLSSVPTSASHLEWIDQPNLNLGTIRSAYPYSGKYQFSFRNAGAKRLTIARVTTSCGCAEAKSSVRTLDSGETGIISVALLKNRSGPFNESVLMETDSQNDSQYLIRVSGTVAFINDAMVTPGDCRFDLCENSVVGSRSRVIQLYSWADEYGNEKLLKAETSLLGDVRPFIQIKNLSDWRPIEQKDARHGMVREFQIELNGNPPIGIHTGEALIKYGEREFHIPVRICVSSPVFAVPPACFITASSVKEDRCVQLKSLQQLPLRVTSVEASAAWVEGSVEHASEKTVKLRIRANEAPRSSANLEKAELHLSGQLDGKSWNLIIPVIYVNR
jgi:hypothetical protein